MTLNEYQLDAKRTAVYPCDHTSGYLALGLAGEAGEVANKVKKEIRDSGDHTQAIVDELGDVLWYLSQLAAERGYSLEGIAQRNLDKLAARKAAGTLKGSGDER